LLWAGAAFAQEGWTAIDEWRRRGRFEASSFYWRFEVPQTTALELCLARAARVMPGGTVVALYDPTQDIFRWRWAAYLLPTHDVVISRDAEAFGASFYVTLGPRPPRGKLLMTRPGCQVFRLR
jgi:hypothetical protein